MNVHFGGRLVKEMNVYKVCVTCFVCLVNWPNRAVCRYQQTTFSARSELFVPLGKVDLCSLGGAYNLTSIGFVVGSYCEWM